MGDPRFTLKVFLFGAAEVAAGVVAGGLILGVIAFAALMS
jgi:hypothetical protein